VFKEALFSLLPALLRPLGGPHDRDGREDYHQCDQTSVIKIVQNNCPPSLTPASPKVSVNKLQIAVFQARAATRPRAVVINYENVSSSSPVNDISFQPLAAL
jgi:hypothetical protein